MQTQPVKFSRRCWNVLCFRQIPSDQLKSLSNADNALKQQLFKYKLAFFLKTSNQNQSEKYLSWLNAESHHFFLFTTLLSNIACALPPRHLPGVVFLPGQPLLPTLVVQKWLHAQQMASPIKHTTSMGSCFHFPNLTSLKLLLIELVID